MVLSEAGFHGKDTTIREPVVDADPHIEWLGKTGGIAAEASRSGLVHWMVSREGRPTVPAAAQRLTAFKFPPWRLCRACAQVEYSMNQKSRITCWHEFVGKSLQTRQRQEAIAGA